MADIGDLAKAVIKNTADAATALTAGAGMLYVETTANLLPHMDGSKAGIGAAAGALGLKKVTDVVSKRRKRKKQREAAPQRAQALAELFDQAGFARGAASLRMNLEAHEREIISADELHRTVEDARRAYNAHMLQAGAAP